MNQNATTTQPLYSTLGADPDLGEIVEMFVEEMSDRVSSLQKLLEVSDWEELRRIAHQLKGAAGSYGFGPISPAAATVEATIRDSEPEEQIHQAVEELCDLCSRARAGAPQ